jgi:hypothetical protein
MFTNICDARYSVEVYGGTDIDGRRCTARLSGIVVDSPRCTLAIDAVVTHPCNGNLGSIVLITTGCTLTPNAYTLPERVAPTSYTWTTAVARDSINWPSDVVVGRANNITGLSPGTCAPPPPPCHGVRTEFVLHTPRPKSFLCTAAPTHCCVSSAPRSTNDEGFCVRRIGCKVFLCV